MICGRSRWLALGLLILAGVAALKILAPHAQNRAMAAPPTTENPLRSQAAAQTPHPKITGDESAKLASSWAALLADLKTNPDPEKLRKRLLATRKSWAAGDPQVLAEFIGRLLHEGADQPLPFAYQVSLLGKLDGWPSLRVYLLDALALSDPEAAAAIAREILQNPANAAEYATALRSLTREGIAAAPPAELLGYFQSALAKTEWQGDRAFAESLDLARYLGSRDTAAILLDWQGPERMKNTVLHELAAEKPGVVLSQPALQEIPEPLRATLIARADLTDPAQQCVVENFVRDPSLAAGEAEKFFSLFPLRSATVGNRLYAGAPRPYTEESTRAIDSIAIGMTDRWLADPAMERHRAALDELRERLAGWSDKDE